MVNGFILQKGSSVGRIRRSVCGMEVSVDQIDKIGNILTDTKFPISERYRALFTLENIKGPKAAEWIMKVLHDDSELLAHEAAYCLGQMEEKSSIECLKSVLENEIYPAIVRHEAAEALGAIADESTISLLKKYEHSPIVEIAETCQLAIRRIDYHKNENTENKITENNLATIDPTPSLNYNNINDLRDIFLDPTTDLFERYRAMFTLRNIASDEAVNIIANGLYFGGALFRHEVAFVLGQLQSEVAVFALINALKDENQHPMVRHECAIALGSISSKKSMDCLLEIVKHPNRLINESCVVAIDMLHHTMSDEFQYANKLV